MERAEKIGLGVAAVGHIVLFGLLSIGFLATPNPAKLKQQPVEVSLVQDVAIESASPNPAEAATSQAPEVGLPEEAAPPEPVEAPPEPKPEPAPAPPQPAPEPKPQPKPAPPKPEPKPQPKPAPKPAPAPKPVPQPKPAPAKPAPRPKPAPAKPAPQPKPAPAKPAPAKAAPAKPAAKPAASTAKPASASRGTGSSPTATAARPRGGRLGNDFLKGLTDQPSKSTAADAAPAAKMGTQQAANIGSAIRRQVQPCANRQVTPGPGAERIQVTINLRLNRDGSLAARPRVVGHSGVDDGNERYVARVDDLAIATFVGCSPLTGLPAELYDVQNGWSNFTLRYKLPG